MIEPGKLALPLQRASGSGGGGRPPPSPHLFGRRRVDHVSGSIGTAQGAQRQAGQPGPAAPSCHRGYKRRGARSHRHRQ